MKIPFWAGTSLALANIALAVIPIYNLAIAIPLSLIFLTYGVYAGWINKPTTIDLIMVPASSLLLLLLFVGAGLATFNHIGWTELIIAGLLSDAVAFILGLVPFIGDLVSSIIVFLIVSMATGGFTGMVLATIASTIALIPFLELPGIITATLIIIKIVSEAIL